MAANTTPIDTIVASAQPTITSADNINKGLSIVSMVSPEALPWVILGIVLIFTGGFLIYLRYIRADKIGVAKAQEQASVAGLTTQTISLTGQGIAIEALQNRNLTLENNNSTLILQNHTYEAVVLRYETKMDALDDYVRYAAFCVNCEEINLIGLKVIRDILTKHRNAKWRPPPP
jgi:hypothetical protein